MKLTSKRGVELPLIFFGPSLSTSGRGGQTNREVKRERWGS